MPIARVDTDISGAVSPGTGSTKFALVLSSDCTESMLDPLESFFKNRNLDLLSNRKTLRSKVTSTCRSTPPLTLMNARTTTFCRTCTRVKMKHFKQLAKDNPWVTPNLLTFEVVDVDKMMFQLEAHPFKFDLGNELWFI